MYFFLYVSYGQPWLTEGLMKVFTPWSRTASAHLNYRAMLLIFPADETRGTSRMWTCKYDVPRLMHSTLGQTSAGQGRPGREMFISVCVNVLLCVYVAEAVLKQGASSWMFICWYRYIRAWQSQNIVYNTPYLLPGINYCQNQVFTLKWWPRTAKVRASYYIFSITGAFKPSHSSGRELKHCWFNVHWILSWRSVQLA